MKHFNLTVNAATTVGQREKNQDNMRVSPSVPFLDINTDKFAAVDHFTSDELHVFCVCDGIGGGEKGEAASQKALEAIDKYLKSTENDDVPLDELLSKLIDCANQEVIGLFDSDRPTGGTTIAMLAIKNDEYATINLGDSPIFLSRNNEIINRSIEHNLAGYKKLRGLPYDEDDACALIYFLGKKSDTASELAFRTNGTIEDNDMFLLCSDGLTNFYSNESLLSEIFSQKETLEVAAEKSGSLRYADNCTAILITCSSQK